MELEDGSSVLVDEEYVRESIADPNAKIRKGFAPGMVAEELNEEDFSALIDFLKELVSTEEASENGAVQE